MTSWDTQLYFLIGATPIFIVWLVGIWLCIHNHWQHRKASLLVGTAIAISLGARLILPILSNLVMGRLFPDLLSSEFGRILHSFVYSIPYAISWGLLLWAVFGARERDNDPQDFFNDEQPANS